MGWLDLSEKQISGKMTVIVMILLIMVMNLMDNHMNRNPNSISVTDQSSKKFSSILSSFTLQNPIFIDDDSDFGASGYNFPGSGTSTNPYVIEGYNITDLSTNLIEIQKFLYNLRSIKNQ